jgi:hypothetical protein
MEFSEGIFPKLSYKNLIKKDFSKSNKRNNDGEIIKYHKKSVSFISVSCFSWENKIKMLIELLECACVRMNKKNRRRTRRISG